MSSFLANYDMNQWGILALVLLLGFLLGMMARSGGAKWRRLYANERAARIEAERRDEARIRAANDRIAVLERKAPAVAVASALGDRDDLSLIRGVGGTGANHLNRNGIYRYRDITALSATDEAALEASMKMEPGTIERLQWREQAALLDSGKADAHRERFADVA